MVNCSLMFCNIRCNALKPRWCQFGAQFMQQSIKSNLNVNYTPTRFLHTFGKNTTQNVLQCQKSSGYLTNPQHLRTNIAPICRSFRTTAPRNVIPPLVLLLLSKSGKLVAAFVGRQVRKWWLKLPEERKTVYAGQATRHRKYLYGLLASLGIGAYVYYLTHIQETPITKRSRFVAFTDAQLDEISGNEKKRLLDIYQKKLLPPSDPRHKRVYAVAQNLVNANKDLLELHGKNKNWTVSVIDDDTMNAFVLSCGSIFVFSGILTVCEDNDSSLALILAHELSHVLLNHSAEQASFLHLLDFLFIIPFLVVWVVIPSDAGAAFLQWLIGWITDLFFGLPYGRALETEADEVGLILAAKACFDVRECLIWKKMEFLNNSAENANVEWLSTHPSGENRYENLQAVLPRALTVREECKCPKLPFLDLDKQMQQFKQRQLSTKGETVLAVPLHVKG